MERDFAAGGAGRAVLEEMKADVHAGKFHAFEEAAIRTADPVSGNGLSIVRVRALLAALPRTARRSAAPGGQAVRAVSRRSVPSVAPPEANQRSLGRAHWPLRPGIGYREGDSFYWGWIGSHEAYNKLLKRVKCRYRPVKFPAVTIES